MNFLSFLILKRCVVDSFALKVSKTLLLKKAERGVFSVLSAQVKGTNIRGGL